MADSDEKHGGEAVDHTRQLPRLRRIEGQVGGLQQMIQDRRYCGDVANQIDAVIAALQRVQSDMLGDHLKACIAARLSDGLSEGERQRRVDEIARLMTRLNRRP